MQLCEADTKGSKLQQYIVYVHLFMHLYFFLYGRVLVCVNSVAVTFV